MPTVSSQGAVTYGILAVGLVAAFASQSWPWNIRTVILLVLAIILGAILFLIFITATRKRGTAWQTARKDRNSEDPEYYLFVLGSGGHTKEMLMMMDDGTSDFARFHRRYIISSGDNMSMNHLQEYEESLQQICKTNHKDPGTYDTKVVTRARRVHQSLLTTPFSALRSIHDIVPALRAPPKSGGIVSKAKPYPSQVFSNGPATSFFVAVVIHVLKIFYIVPEDCMRFVYIESWARISTLSLTGKLFYYTGLADLFFVQHSKVAEKYGVKNAGQMVFNTRRLTD